MKKKLIVGLLLLAIIMVVIGIFLWTTKPKEDTGEPAQVKKQSEKNESQAKEKIKELQTILINYGKKTFDNDTWMKGNIEVKTYFVSIENMQNDPDFDIKKFVNPLTGEACDKESTGLEFIVKEGTDETHTVYEFHPVLLCGLAEENGPVSEDAS